MAGYEDWVSSRLSAGSERPTIAYQPHRKDIRPVKAMLTTAIIIRQGRPDDYPALQNLARSGTRVVLHPRRFRQRHGLRHE